MLVSGVLLFNSCYVMSHSCGPHGPQGLQASLSLTISWSFLKLMSIEFIMLSTHLILCHFLLLPSIFPNIRVFSNELALYIRSLLPFFPHLFAMGPYAMIPVFECSVLSQLFYSPLSPSSRDSSSSLLSALSVYSKMIQLYIYIYMCVYIYIYIYIHIHTCIYPFSNYFPL